MQLKIIHAHVHPKSSLDKEVQSSIGSLEIKDDHDDGLYTLGENRFFLETAYTTSLAGSGLG